MIKQLNLNIWQDLTMHLNKTLQEGYTHFILVDDFIHIYPEMLNNVTLDQSNIVADYTVNGLYQNDCRYFAQETITFNDWIENINHYPNVIYHIETTLTMLETHHVNTMFDLAVHALLQDTVKVDPHVVFDYQQTYLTSSQLWEEIKKCTVLNTTKFNLNKLAYIHKHSIPFKNYETLAPDQLRYTDKLIKNFRFKLPHWIYNFAQHHFTKKHRQMSYIYEKNENKLKDHIVFLGFDYGFRGNSRYLFNHFAKHFAKVPIYFVTEDVNGPNFIKPNDPNTKALIESARVVILESNIPDDIRPNGTIIQLWHGTPIKKLFLDSHEVHQNSKIYNYRARKYNKWLQQNYLICDCEEIIDYFKSAFPLQHTKVVSSGYPRVKYLLDKQKDTPYVKFIKHELKIDPAKPTLLYVPTWKTTEDESDLLPLSDGLLNKYNVIYKGHIENTSTYLPENAIIAPANIETQDLILISDVVLTDYSSIIFDALTLDKTVCQFTPNHEKYIAERGVYEDVMHSLAVVRYSDAKALLNDLISFQMSDITNNAFVNKNNHAFETISNIIKKHMNL
ncbi:CDP-glycerol glycerophosphotransferase family protein [Staphylococcus arlettae]|uniref:CDP-glycerol glycerophosphotransferase family protein n=1 Tax=Staphylococcus arlettae TaxID=29378 RepID=UPI000DCCC8F0|nr:CDP-glycerol glycerophosphotransferase family protein [Staphylococcus arlettae]RBA01574.1 CDP-glycerol:poly(glycerophosphate) glycerophosphotransferase [Staphylococcus arlettae]RBA04254.1 CDP-glycerol:poly(glycerophosphate) glycerophosphotransferase [Staphylococcus arlettae]RBA06401.1 CDP-glycerol:poly(glycerophosphate) glycerophosphotransferase [Staphylococcus arlettae]